MALFKGDISDEAIAAATERLLKGEPAVGIGGQVLADKDWVTITRKGAFAKTQRGSGEMRIPIRNVTAVDLKDPGAKQGFISFSLLGGSNVGRKVNSAFQNEHSVMFSRNQSAAFYALKRLVEGWMQAAHQPAQPVVVAAPVDVADQIAKMGALRDQGLITEEEFVAHKATLFGTAAPFAAPSAASMEPSSSPDAVVAAEPVAVGGRSDGLCCSKAVGKPGGRHYGPCDSV